MGGGGSVGSPWGLSVDLGPGERFVFTSACVWPFSCTLAASFSPVRVRVHSTGKLAAMVVVAAQDASLLRVSPPLTHAPGSKEKKKGISCCLCAASCLRPVVVAVVLLLSPWHCHRKIHASSLRQSRTISRKHPPGQARWECSHTIQLREAQVGKKMFFPPRRVMISRALSRAHHTTPT
ncbi:Hypothetical predicted protein, partial [Olea europaea subsp. europaea]